MSRKTILLILSIYGLLLSLALIFFPAVVMKDFGYNTIDVLHKDLSVLLGLADLIVVVFIFIHRKSEDKEPLNTILWITFWLLFTSAVYNTFAAFDHAANTLPLNGIIQIVFSLILAIGLGVYLRKSKG